MPVLSNGDLSKNQILNDLPRLETESLMPHLQHVVLKLGEFLYRTGEPLRYNYFPMNSVISAVASMKDGKSVEVGLKGNEGVAGIEAILGAKTAMRDAIVQVPDGCLRIKTEALLTEFHRGGVLHYRLLHYAGHFLEQVAQTAACNRVHLLEQRLARWLLMIRNRVTTDDFPMTHEFLSYMLGTARSEVTMAAASLRKAGYIRYEHGRMTILDRKGLESAACECYLIVSDESARPS